MMRCPLFCGVTDEETPQGVEEVDDAPMQVALKFDVVDRW